MLNVLATGQMILPVSNDGDPSYYLWLVWQPAPCQLPTATFAPWPLDVIYEVSRDNPKTINKSNLSKFELDSDINGI